MTPVLHIMVLKLTAALSPVDRWRAAGRFFDTGPNKWLVVAAVLGIVILTALLVFVSLRRKDVHKRVADQMFFDYARRRGLSIRECQLLLDVATKAGLKETIGIFTMETVFARGASKLIEESLTSSANLDHSEQLSSELSFLREKLGFKKQYSAIFGRAAGHRNLSSRQIPVGRKVTMTRRKSRDTGDIEATVVKNDDIELTVKVVIPLKSACGEPWRIRYYFGASVWEFDTSVINSEDDILVLNHSDNVRFINRRRFLRVPVKKAAFVAPLPFSRQLDIEAVAGSAEQHASPNAWDPPQFVPAVVTELAGPGLRIDVPLELKVGERVLVMARLNGARGHDSGPAGSSDRKATAKIIQDIGVVRHIRAADTLGWSIAVELTGLDDSNVGELVRATNLAYLETGGNSKELPALADAEEAPAETVTV